MDPFAAEAERPIKIPPYFDGIFYPLGMEAVPRRLAVVRANRYIVDNNNFLIAYAWHPASNAREEVRPSVLLTEAHPYFQEKNGKRCHL